MKNRLARCPHCGFSITLGNDARVGEMIVCPACGEELEIVDLDPPRLDFASAGEWEEGSRELWKREEE